MNKGFSKYTHPRRRATILLQTCKMRAKKIGKPFNLRREWLLEKLERGYCEATGILFQYEAGNGSASKGKYGPSIDRIDSSKGYTEDNCQVVIFQYNVAKGQWSESDLRNLAEAICHPRKMTSTA